MKRTFILFLVLSASFVTTAQVQTSCFISPAFRAAYEDDAKSLATQRLYEIQSPDTQLIDVPQVHVDSVLTGLATIFNLDTMLQADSIFRYHCIHSEAGFQSPVCKGLSLVIDTTYAWTQQWVNQQTLTGYGALDSLLVRHGLTFGSIMLFQGMGFVQLTTSKVINMQALSDSLALLNGINSASKNCSPGDAPKLITYTSDSLQRFGFRIGWGDCPAGCTETKTWQYSVDPQNCTVSLDSILQQFSFYFGYPALVNCNLLPTTSVPQVNASPGVLLHPNPAGNFVSIKNFDENFHYLISDMSGRIVTQGSGNSGQTIDLSRLEAGIYLIRLRGASEQWQQKLIKY